MLRSWQDVVTKWRDEPQDWPVGDPDDPAAVMSGQVSGLHRGRVALLDGRLDDAWREFDVAASDAQPRAEVGLGDVYLARNQWRRAAEHYQRALDLEPGNLLARLGLNQVRVCAGDAASAVTALEDLHAARPDDQVVRYYLASAWCSAAEQCRSRTDDDVLVITSEKQLRYCEQAARRIVELDVADRELAFGANRLMAEVAAGRRWLWAPEGIAVSLLVLTMAFGLTAVVAGGAMTSPTLVVGGVVVGGAVLVGIVLRCRRQVWRVRADALARRIHITGW